MRGQRYFLLDMERTVNSDVCWWWKPQSRGYTTDLSEAGIYSEEVIQADATFRDRSTIQVPVDEAHAMVSPVVVNDQSAIAEWKMKSRKKFEEFPF